MQNEAVFFIMILMLFYKSLSFQSLHIYSLGRAKRRKRGENDRGLKKGTK
jgi:hypothetical protein